MSSLDYEFDIMLVGYRWRLKGARWWRWAPTMYRAERAAARAGSESARIIVAAREEYGSQ